MKDAGGDVSHVVAATPNVAANTVPRARVLFIDLLRVLAAFQMLQGHTIAALLAGSYRHGLLYSLWYGARGLTSIAFLFASGLRSI